MKSEFEKFSLEQLTAFRNMVRGRDRGVLIGAGLSFIPIFPACFFGFAISFVNLLLINKKRLEENDRFLVNCSLLFGGFFSVLWLYLIFSVGIGVTQALGIVYDALITVLSSFFSDLETNGPPAQDAHSAGFPNRNPVLALWSNQALH